MRRTTTLGTIILPLLSAAQGFGTSPTNWPLPSGGRLEGGITYGYNALGGSAASGQNTGSETWGVADMNGDGRPDLVVTAALNGSGQDIQFTQGGNSYWKVYLNSGSGFSGSYTTWSTPEGGKLSGGITYGFNALGGTANNTQTTGSESWSLADLDGDGRPDLVVTAVLNGSGQDQEFSPGSNSFWNVFHNNGGGFDPGSTVWSLPSGGKLEGGVTLGFNALGGTAQNGQNSGSESWAITDMNGDGRPDLVVTASYNSGAYAQEFSPGSNSYWKVFTNNGSGFSSSSSNWNLPAGGRLEGGVTYGYNALGGTAASGQNSGSETWSVADMNGDGRPDLVVTASYSSGAYAQEFSPGSNSYWKVYTNTGSSFNTSSSEWSLPSGGRLEGGVTYGYNALGGTAASGQNSGSESWAIADLNSDDKPDLVVTASYSSGNNAQEFSPGNNSYWKLYSNTGSAFNTSPINWGLPAGGRLEAGITYGFNALGGTAATGQNSDSESWSVLDITGDGDLDLVVTGSYNSATYAQEFSPGSNSYWEVFDGSGASAVDELGLGDGLSLYPNPALLSVRIEASEAFQRVELLDQRGRVVRTARAGGTSIPFDLNGIEEGAYIIRIIAGDRISTRKLMIVGTK